MIGTIQRWLALALALAVALTACGGSAGDEAGSDDSGDDNRPRSFSDLEYQSPIGDLLGFDPTGNDDMEAEFAERERRAQEDAARCMQELGFEYKPVDQSQFTVFGPGDEMEWFSPEWVDKYGLGISTMRYPEEMVGPDLVGSPGGFGPDPIDDFSDPNQDYLESLSDAERDAYFEALYGAPPELDPTSMSEEEMDAAFRSYEPDGCLPLAQQAAFEESGTGVDTQEFFETFGDELESLWERAEADPEVVAYRERVASCVSEAGWAMSTEEEIYEYFERKMNGIEDPFMSFAASFDDAAGDDESMVPPEPELPTMDPASKAILAEVQAEELEFAQVLVGCDGGPVNEQWFLGEVRVRLEQEFIDANADAIAEITGG